MIKETPPHLPTQEEIEITTALQTACIEAYQTVANSLQPGMTETQIATALQSELKTQGITDFWYNVPILVLAGPKRFNDMANPDYATKSPKDIQLNAGMPFFIDIHPRHESGRWGNFAATAILFPDDHPQGQQALAFLNQMQIIQAEGIASLTPNMTGAAVCRWFTDQFSQAKINLTDVRGNFGHSMGYGPKTGPYQRQFLDIYNQQPIGGQIFGIEPGGYLQTPNGIFIARFEDCVHIPQQGSAQILGRQKPVPVSFVNR